MAKTKSKRLPRPASVDSRVGCKVMWLYFKTEEEAKSASEIAVHNAKLDWEQGYDFGYQTPGTVKLVKDYQGDLAVYNGLWEVCFS